MSGGGGAEMVAGGRGRGRERGGARDGLGGGPRACPPHQRSRGRQGFRASRWRFSHLAPGDPPSPCLLLSLESLSPAAPVQLFRAGRGECVFRQGALTQRRLAGRAMASWVTRPPSLHNILMGAWCRAGSWTLKATTPFCFSLGSSFPTSPLRLPPSKLPPGPSMDAAEK